jgi:hypothetical protein
MNVFGLKYGYAVFSNVVGLWVRFSTPYGKQTASQRQI